MNEKNQKRINNIADLLDQLAMAYYDEQRQKRHLYYFEALMKVMEYLRTEDEWLNTIEGVDLLITFLKESSIDIIQQALLLVEVKGLKHQNYVLDVLVPEGIALLAAYLFYPYVANENEVHILGVNFGLGHFFFNQALMWKHTNLTFQAIENDEIIGRYIMEKSYLLNQALTVKKLVDWKQINDLSDLVIGDMRSEVVLSPIQAIIEIETLTNAEASLYLVDAEFFKQKEINYFKEQINKVSQLAAFVLLPDAFFQNERVKKAFLILTKSKRIDVKRSDSLGVFALPNLNDPVHLQATLSEIRAFIKE